jgi:hypothetical protein
VDRINRGLQDSQEANQTGLVFDSRLIVANFVGYS